MDGLTNFTSSTHEPPGPTHSIPYTCVLFSVSVLIIMVNLNVICLYTWRKRHILSTLHNRILLSLSVCDLLTGCAVMLNAVCHLKQTEDYTFRIVKDILTTFLVKTAILHLCGITIDRYLSLFLALRYRALVTRRAVSLYIMCAWTLPLTASLVAFSWLHRIITPTDDVIEQMSYERDIRNIEIWYSTISLVIFVAIPMLLLGVAFIHMFVEIRRLMHSTPRHHCAAVSPCKRRLIYIFGSMYTTFTVLAMPYFGLRLWNDIHYWSVEVPPITHIVVIRVSIILKAMASFVNPLLYTYSSPELRLLSQQARHRFVTSKSVRRCRKMSTDVMRRLSSGQERWMRRVGRVEGPDVERLKKVHEEDAL